MKHIGKDLPSGSTMSVMYRLPGAIDLGNEYESKGGNGTRLAQHVCVRDHSD